MKSYSCTHPSWMADNINALATGTWLVLGGELRDISGTIIWWNEVSVVEYSNQHRHIVLLPTSCVVGPSRYKFHEILMVL